MKNKVLIILNTNIVGGAERVLVDYLKNNNELEFYLYTNNDKYIKGIFENTINIKYIFTSKHMITPMNLKKHKYLIPVFMFRLIINLININRIVKKEDINVIYGNNSLDIVPIVAYKIINKKIRVISHIHDMLNKDILAGKFLSKYCAYIDEIIVPSNSTKDAINKLVNDRVNINVVYNSVERSAIENDKYDAFISQYMLDENLKHIGFIGTITDRKNPLLFIDIIEKMYNIRKDFNAIIVGKIIDKELYNQVMNIINEKKLPVAVLGEMTKEQMWFIYEYIDVLLLTSKSDPLPTVILEAMQSKTVVLARNVDGVNEMIADGYNGFIFSADVLEDILDKLDFILNLDSAQRLNLTSNAEQVLENKFSKEKKEHIINNLIIKLNGDISK